MMKEKEGKSLITVGGLDLVEVVKDGKESLDRVEVGELAEELRAIV